MNRNEIATLLNTNFNAFAHFIDSLSNHRFAVSPEGKWSAGQQLDHLLRSTKPVNKALSLPKLALRWYGKPKTPSRGYEALVNDYRQQLSKGFAATREYIPGIIELSHREPLLKQFYQQKERLIQQIESWTEEELDNYVLPHPLLGKITIREVLYFTAYHTAHHLHDLQTREQLRKNPWNSALEEMIF
ncbi:DinB family protein [Chitinophaga horti]|uniref:DinB family protein n=1 Tax=Chitinophaga horti TaxID=2920382 RepID=A0ABY6J1L1_9BACT|nr:DinB family protein [Chitinophaga horti]UYQ93546.1 DinB family protein [Chitinophaga horti]